jgi:hypothetical protein
MTAWYLSGLKSVGDGYGMRGWYLSGLKSVGDGYGDEMILLNTDHQNPKEYL